MDKKEIIGLCLLFLIIGFCVGLIYGGYIIKEGYENFIEYPQPTKDSCIELFSNLKY